jgi:hypothetical protein
MEVELQDENCHYLRSMEGIGMGFIYGLTEGPDSDNLIVATDLLSTGIAAPESA